MDITTNTLTFIIIKLDETEARQALIEPRDLQAQLRAALAPIAAARQTRRSLRLGKGAPKAKAGPQASTRQPGSGKTACSICGKSLKPRGMALHLRKAHPDAAASADSD